MSDDAPTPDGSDDEDRAAILARRRFYVVVALTGAAVGGYCVATPCLRYAPPRDASVSDAWDAGDADDADVPPSDAGGDR